MIESGNGRARSVRLTHEYDAFLGALFGDLEQDEIDTINAIMSDVGNGDLQLLNLISASHYKEEPVSMRQFLEDDYYMGISAKTLYPRLKKDLIHIFDDGGYSEVILTGSIGIGKSTVASYITCRLLYELLCLRDPQMSFGLSAGSEMHLVLLSKNLSLARRVMLSAVMEKIKLSPWFSQMERKEARDEVFFPGSVVLSIGSVMSERVLGLNVYSCVMDEINFMTSTKQVSKPSTGGKVTVANFDRAEKLYTTLDSRIRSRFMQGGRIPGLNVLLSSKTTKTSFVERRIRSSRLDSTVFVSDYATWDVKRSGTFSGNTFRVLVGSAMARSRILDDGEHLDDVFLAESGSYVVDVPVEYRKQFELDLNKSIRDVAGLSTDAIHAYMARQEMVTKIFSDELVNPFTVEDWVYGTPGEFRWSVMCDTYERRLRGGHKESAWKPKRNPKALRHIHIDVAISGDSLGIAMGFIDRWEDVVRFGPDGAEYWDIAPVMELDFALRVSPPSGEYIYLPDIRAIVYDMIEHGYHVSAVTMDSYQSTDSIQQFKARGIRSYVLSVDRTTKGYDSLKHAIYEGRLRSHESGILLHELLGLEFDSVRGKVDHQPGGSKDVADAVAGVVQGLTENSNRVPIPMSVGSSSSLQEDPDADGGWVLSGGMVPVSSNKLDQRPSGKIRTKKAPTPAPFLIG